MPTHYNDFKLELDKSYPQYYSDYEFSESNDSEYDYYDSEYEMDYPPTTQPQPKSKEQTSNSTLKKEDMKLFVPESFASHVTLRPGDAPNRIPTYTAYTQTENYSNKRWDNSFPTLWHWPVVNSAILAQAKSQLLLSDRSSNICNE